MNKSTPLVQLPSPQVSQVPQVPQVPQVQQVPVQVQSIPQNSQMPSDIINDDDNVVQDILNQINAGSNQHPSQVSQQQNFQDIRNLQAMQNMQAMQNVQAMQNIQTMQNMQANVPLVQTFQDPTQETDYKVFFFQFADDIKLASVVFFAVIIVHFVPVSSWVSKYIAVDKIPYHEIILRAILVTLLVIIFKKLMKI